MLNPCTVDDDSAEVPDLCVRTGRTVAYKFMDYGFIIHEVGENVSHMVLLLSESSNMRLFVLKEDQ